MKVEKARREQIKVPILLMGASGAGKTLSALLMAYGMAKQMHPKMSEEKLWDKVGFVDTEHKRASLYVDTTHDDVKIGQFPVINLEPPFDSQHLLEAVRLLKEAGSDVVIIDSLTSAWSGEGGIMDQVDKLGGGMGGWRDVAPEQRKMLKILMDQDVHVIATARSKQGIEVTTDDNGKIKIEKVGLKIEQKDSIEYEFAITFQIYQNHSAQAMKDNSSIFNTPGMINPEYGEKIIQWAEQGIDVKGEEKKRATKALKMINEIVGKSETAKKEVERQVQSHNNVPIEQWPLQNLRVLYATLNKIKPEIEKKEGK